MKRLVHCAAAVVTAIAVGTIGTSAARADAPSAYAPPLIRQREARTIEQSRPNVGLISSGVFTFGIPYVTSVVVASQSTREADEKLYVPVAGP